MIYQWILQKSANAMINNQFIEDGIKTFHNSFTGLRLRRKLENKCVNCLLMCRIVLQHTDNIALNMKWTCVKVSTKLLHQNTITGKLLNLPRLC